MVKESKSSVYEYVTAMGLLAEREQIPQCESLNSWDNKHSIALDIVHGIINKHSQYCYNIWEWKRGEERRQNAFWKDGVFTLQTEDKMPAKPVGVLSKYGINKIK